jgi:mannose-1-phosphate guanylyltransferase
VTDSSHAPPPFVAVIMAGGQGQRFWPLSTSERPKQFLDLERRGRTLIQATYDRLLPLTGTPEGIYVATGSRYVGLVREQLPDLPGGNLLIEPTARDSGPAVALASLAIHARTGGAMMGFFSADHRIGAVPPFHAAVRDAITLAEAERGLVTLGITPTHPATGYGYIERGAPCGPGFRVARFVEKPTAARAQRYLDAGTFAWNAGIFVWRSDVILEELDRHAPEIMRPLRLSVAEGSVAQVFPTLPKISIDYALLERTEHAFVVNVDCDWDDIGDWVALERLLALSDDDGSPNTVVGKHVGYEASGNIIYTEQAEDVIVTVGVHDLVVVKRGNTVLLVAKDRIADVKRVLEDERLDG